MSQTGMVIIYADCPIFWQISLQTEISLTTVAEEYITISSALRQVLPLMTTTEEINEVLSLPISNDNFVCKFHEDNQSCVKMATGNFFSLRTKHIALKYQHFRSYVKSGLVDIHYRLTGAQLANILIKPLSNEAFLPLVTCSADGFIPNNQSRIRQIINHKGLQEYTDRIPMILDSQ